MKRSLEAKTSQVGAFPVFLSGTVSHGNPFADYSGTLHVVDAYTTDLGVRQVSHSSLYNEQHTQSVKT